MLSAALVKGFSRAGMASAASGKVIYRGGSRGGPPLQMSFQGRVVPWPAPGNRFSGAGPVSAPVKLDL